MTSGLPLIVRAELDQQSATQAAADAERLFEQTSRDIAREWEANISRGTAQASAAVDQMADNTRDAYRRMGSAADDLRRQQQILADMQANGADAQQVRIQSERVAQARRDETQATRDAARAYDQYVQSIRDASAASAQASSSLTSGLRAAAGEAGSAGQEAASGFFDGFAGSAAIMRIGAAGGPVGLALAAAAALGVGAGKLLADNMAIGLESLAQKDLFQARTGVSDAVRQRAGSAAGDAYTNAWGASPEDNLRAATFGVQSGLIDRNATGVEFQGAIENLQALAELLEVDVQDAARAAGQLIRGGFAADGEEAFDILASGAQRGLDISGDWLDTVSEYSTQWRKLGLDAGDALGLLQQGLEGNARDTDVVADSLKEFSIRAVDGSKESAEAFDALGFNAEDLFDRFSQGGPVARQAFGEVLAALRDIDDPMQQNLIWVRLFGTQFEDMGDAVNKLDLSTAKGQFTDYQGAIEGAKNKMSEHISQWDTLGRNIDQTMTKFQEWLANSPAGNFFMNTLPGFINDQFFGQGPTPPTQNQPPAADQATSMPGVPGSQANATGPGPRDPGSGRDDWMNGVDAGQRARAGLPPLPPGTTGPQPAPPPPPGAPGGPLPAPPARGAPNPIVPDHLADDAGGDKPKPVFDPSQYSLDAIPLGEFPGVGSSGMPGAMPSLSSAGGQFSDSNLQPNAARLNDLIAQAFPQIKDIGGWRASDPFPDHPSGKALDIMIPGWDTPQGKALGDQIWQWLNQNADSLGIDSTIWQDYWSQAGDPQGGHKLGRQGATQGHYDHIHALTRGGAASPMSSLAMPGGMPGAPGGQVDPQQVFNAESRVISARNNVEESRIALLTLESDGTATAQEVQAAKNRVVDSERALYSAQMDLAKAQQGTFDKMQSAASSASQSMGQIGATIDQDFGVSGGLPGIVENLVKTLGNLAFAPMLGQLSAISAANPIQGGHGLMGVMGAQNIAAGGSPLGLSTPPGLGGGGFPGLPGMPTPVIASRADGGFGTLPGDATIQRPAGRGLVQWAEDRTGGEAFIPLRGGQRSIDIWAQTGRFLGMFDQGGILEDGRPQIGGRPMGAGVGGGGFQGLGGVPMAAIQTAASSLDMLAPGAGQAAQTGIQLANRAIGYAGQLGGIGASALLETFSLNQSALADPSRSWIGRFATGFAGARPALPNAAGQAQPAAPAMSPQQVAANQGAHQGTGGAPGPAWTGDYHNHNATEDRAGADISRHLTAMYGARLGKR